MARSLGSRLPEGLLKRLSDPDISQKASRVIIFTTVDEQGFPHHGMLSPFEVVARVPSRLLMLTYANSRSTRNMKRTGTVTLLFVDEEMSYYVKGRCRETDIEIPEAPGEIVFSVEVMDVIDDRVPTAQVLTGITFEGYDPGMTREGRENVFRSLIRLSTET